MAGRSCLEPPPRLDQLGRSDAEGLGRGEQIGLVRLEETEHGGEQARIAQPVAQILGGEAGQGEQPLRPGRLAKRPAERGQRKRFRVVCVLNPHRLESLAWDKKSWLSRTTSSI